MNDRTIVTRINAKKLNDRQIYNNIPLASRLKNSSIVKRKRVRDFEKFMSMRRHRRFIVIFSEYTARCARTTLHFNSAPSAIGEIADTDRCALPICSSVSLPRARLCSCSKSDVIRAAHYSSDSTGKKNICSISKNKN